MLKITKRYVVNEKNEPIAVQLDWETFQKIERLLEDYHLGQSIKAVEHELSLDRQTARKRLSKYSR